LRFKWNGTENTDVFIRARAMWNRK